MISSFLLGVSLKIVDEVLDKDIELAPFYIETFKCLTILFLVLSTVNDFPFAISTLLSLGFSYLAGGIDDIYWKSFICITTILSCISFMTFTFSVWLVPTFFIMPFIVYGEALIFPENNSFEKMMGSAAMIPLLALFYKSPLVSFFKERIPLNTGIAEKGILFGIGYFLTRAIIKAYIIYKTPSPALSTTSLQKEKMNTDAESIPIAALDSPLPAAEHIVVSDKDTLPLK